jgi:hypothetical protein
LKHWLLKDVNFKGEANDLARKNGLTENRIGNADLTHNQKKSPSSQKAIVNFKRQRSISSPHR